MSDNAPEDEVLSDDEIAQIQGGAGLPEAPEAGRYLAGEGGPELPESGAPMAGQG